MRLEAPQRSPWLVKTEALRETREAPPKWLIPLAGSSPASPTGKDP
jgi:hypothetical protein